MKSILAEQDENYGILEATSMIVRGRRFPIDVTKVEGEYEKNPIYAVLSVTWAIVGDCDLNSEFLRCLGDLRYYLFGAWRATCGVRHYQCDLTITGFRYDKQKQEAY